MQAGHLELNKQNMASGQCTKHVFVTGPPGVGKTTLVQKVTEQLKALSIPVQGFITEEVRNGGRRVGFDVVSLDGPKGVLSRSGSSKPGPKVGQYVVDLKSFESVALPALNLEKNTKPVVVLDEIGKMELFSQTFIRAVGKLLHEGNVTLFGTIPIPKGKPLGLVEEIRNSSSVQVFTLSKANRDEMVSAVLCAIQKSYEVSR